MVFLGLVMMPFYYGSRVRSGLEYLRLRFSNQAHLFNSVAGVYGMANVDRAAAARRHSWWESPPLLGFTALGLAAILTIVSW